MQRIPLKQRVIRLTLFLMVVLVFVCIGIIIWICHLQAEAFAHPIRTHAEITPHDLGIENWESATFTTSDNIRLDGWYFPPAPDSHGSAFIFVHGFTGNRADHAYIAGLLAEQGYGGLMFDLRNHGSSQSAVTTMGYLEVRDVEAAYAFLVAQPEVQHIGILGNSMGGTTAIRAMVRIPTAEVLVIDTAFTSFLDVIGDGVKSYYHLPAFPIANLVVWFTGHKGKVNLFELRPIDEIALIAPRPILFIHGSDDPVIPIEHTRRLYEKAGQPKTLFIVEGGGHGGLFDVDRVGYNSHLLSFLSTYFPAK